ncbi:MAG: SDR family NAD(P)-dependent oxidoreductase [bacterium]|nr:SDR family NAD(P)-dependent oxidoreductase [bacterium]
MALTGKTALVTGGIGDLGNEMAFQLAQAGAHVAIWDLHDPAAAAPRLERLQAAGGRVLYQQVDVRDRADVDAAIAEIAAALGGLDIVCVNAGIVEAAPFLDITPETWAKHLDINLTGAFHTAQAAARHMVAQRTQGRIIFTSSWVADIPWPEITAYTASKAGVNMLMRQMARELAAHGIRVNAVAPGIVRAGLAGRQLVEEPQYAARVAKVIPLGEPGTPVEIAQAVVYLASPQTAYMTGAVLLIDGGCSLFQFDQ